MDSAINEYPVLNEWHTIKSERLEMQDDSETSSADTEKSETMDKIMIATKYKAMEENEK